MDDILADIATVIQKNVFDGKLVIAHPSDIRRAIDSNQLVKITKLDEDARKKLEQLLGSMLVVVREKSSEITKDSEPWLHLRKESINFQFWDRFRSYLLHKHSFPQNVLNRLDEDTDRIIDLCGDPLTQGAWRRSGLVMGHVQSGKTTNYSGVIAKGLDAGYRIFILFAGITNSLRSQTQERIEEGITGKSTRTDKAIGVGLLKEIEIHPTCWTSVDGDFNSQTAQVTQNLSDGGAHVFILKKNVHTIGHLLKWLNRSVGGGVISAPMMLIDDEADNASINTSKDKNKLTAINRGIRKLLEKFEKATYVGYTATPFANIFIDHESDEEMRHQEALGDDLFPRNFIKSLGAPENYVGAARLFGDEDPSRALNHTVVEVEDYKDILPLKHKREETNLTELPPSLYHAIRMFILSCTIRKKKEHWDRHMTMMINVSRFNDVQTQVENLVTDYIDELKNSLFTNGNQGQKALEDPHIRDLLNSFNGEFKSDDTGFSRVEDCKEFSFIEDLLPEIETVLRAIRPQTVNMRTGPLDYSKAPGQKVIAIGGLALSRGLTLEGLSVSYILRNASASDTLMQMARWFGYRIGYEELTRVYLPVTSHNHYKHIHNSIEELRHELALMEKQGRTPLEFGLKVRNSPTGILITAANKSRDASNLMFSRSFENKHVQAYLLQSNEAVRKHNWDLSARLLSDISRPQETLSGPGAFARWNCDVSIVLDYLNEFKIPDSHFDLGKYRRATSLVHDYIFDRAGDELKDWDVILPMSGNYPHAEIDLSPHLIGVKPRIRHQCRGIRSQPGEFKLTGKNMAANPRDIFLGLPKQDGIEGEIFATREKPLLLIHMLHCMQKADSLHESESHTGLSADGDLHFTFSIVFPGTNVACRPVSYLANKVWIRMLEDAEIEDDDIDDDYDAMMAEGAG
ncbi:Z1 domain-containing protein [Kordiimonas lipolytica]|uniref:Z1 domain-containing protein n=1 Tax=Kordiimonas lipolytica TaxID=1662421 RepID=A0ABV8U7A5_9PROT|nr:Z1 domain-containing protein [Kordiimonas lipolytica]